MSDQTQVEKQFDNGQSIRDIVRQAIEEFVSAEQRKAEPAYQTELQDERRRRESLEARLNQLVEENKKARAAAEEADRSSQIRTELQRLGVAKVDLAFRAVKDEIIRTENGHLQSKGSDGKSMQEYLASFVQDNPELLPARITGGSGAHSSLRGPSENMPSIEIEKIKPGMNKEDLERVRKEISRLASQALRGM
jgi:predicted RNase H-like nuclease (RuvC/YqgF family)